MRLLIAVATAWVTAACAPAEKSADLAELAREVLETERAFARTMADRDFAAFAGFLSEETVFFSGEEPMRGKDAVAAAWHRYFEAVEAPFSWAPDQAQVLDSGALALTTGQVRAPTGEAIGAFTSIWRREGPGEWRIVFDKGNPVCND